MSHRRWAIINNAHKILKSAAISRVTDWDTRRHQKKTTKFRYSCCTAHRLWRQSIADDNDNDDDYNDSDDFGKYVDDANYYSNDMTISAMLFHLVPCGAKVYKEQVLYCHYIAYFHWIYPQHTYLCTHTLNITKHYTKSQFIFTPQFASNYETI